MTGSGWAGMVALAAAVTAGQAGETKLPDMGVASWYLRGGGTMTGLKERDQEIARLRAELSAAQHRSELAEAEAIGLLEKLRTSGLTARQQHRIAVAILREAREHRLDPLLVAAVIHAESRFDPFAVSPAGAMGLMQVMPATGRELAKRRGQPLRGSRDLFDAELNIELGTAYLAQLVASFGSVESGLVAYNAGPTAARRILADAQVRRRFVAGYPMAVAAELRRLQARKNARPDDG